jgi:hypothetical protein
MKFDVNHQQHVGSQHVKKRTFYLKKQKKNTTLCEVKIINLKLWNFSFK